MAPIARTRKLGSRVDAGDGLILVLAFLAGWRGSTLSVSPPPRQRLQCIASRSRANTFQNATSCVVAKLMRISVPGIGPRSCVMRCLAIRVPGIDMPPHQLPDEDQDH
ncbi:MAG: hypothetical protein KGQ35_12245, partial [Burkholderiales bacterium]|nr:hypothetical protein [Burkholderiales bacterium]